MGTERIENDTADIWITNEPIERVVRQLHEQAVIDPQRVSGEQLALLVKRLVGSEVKPGGPYKDSDGQEMPVVSGLVKDLFWALKRPSIQSARVKKITPIQRQALSEIAEIPIELHSRARRMVERIIQVDRYQEISLLSEWYAASLAVRPMAANQMFTEKLGVANIYTWVAYTLYDDFIDQESEPQWLPVANALLRLALKIYGDDPLVWATFDRMDQANAWELEHCRFVVSGGVISIGELPRYGRGRRLADRAAAHGLGALLAVQQLEGDSTIFANASRALDNYIIARQIGDDIHDWAEDLARGHISFAVAYLLRKAEIVPGEYAIDELMGRLRYYFWHKGIEELTALQLEAIRRASQALTRGGVIPSDNAFSQHILDPLAARATRSLEAHRQKQHFLAVYKQ